MAAATNLRSLTYVYEESMAIVMTLIGFLRSGGITGMILFEHLKPRLQFTSKKEFFSR